MILHLGPTGRLHTPHPAARVRAPRLATPPPSLPRAIPPCIFRACAVRVHRAPCRARLSRARAAPPTSAAHALARACPCRPASGHSCRWRRGRPCDEKAATGTTAQRRLPPARQPLKQRRQTLRQLRQRQHGGLEALDRAHQPRAAAFLASFSSIPSCSASSSPRPSPDSHLALWSCGRNRPAQCCQRGWRETRAALRLQAFLKTMQDSDISIFVVAR
jgi:hypothetical protein